jgi:glycosyltransferase involved in cell wall biosynthesis
LETLAVGRPVVAMHLPQLEAVIHDGESGYLIPRQGAPADWADALAQRFIDIRDAMDAGTIDPEQVAGAIASFTPATQLARVYRYHQAIQDARGMTAAPAVV